MKSNKYRNIVASAGILASLVGGSAGFMVLRYCAEEETKSTFEIIGRDFEVFESPRINDAEYAAYRNKDYTSLLEQAVRKLKFIDAAIICEELSLPNKVVMDFYEKGRKMKDASIGTMYADIPYSENGIKINGYNLWRKYFDKAKKNCGVGKDNHEFLIREFIYLVRRYNGRISIDDYEEMVNEHDLDRKDNVIDSALRGRVDFLEDVLDGGNEGIVDGLAVLEEVAQGHTLLNQESKAREIVKENFNKIFEERFTKEAEIDSQYAYYILGIKLEKVRHYLDKETFDYWHRRVEELKQSK